MLELSRCFIIMLIASISWPFLSRRAAIARCWLYSVQICRHCSIGKYSFFTKPSMTAGEMFTSLLSTSWHRSLTNRLIYYKNLYDLSLSFIALSKMLNLISISLKCKNFIKKLNCTSGNSWSSPMMSWSEYELSYQLSISSIAF